jgi:hypothetical protein
MSALQEKVAVITGGSSGIGLAIARRFASPALNDFRIAQQLFLCKWSAYRYQKLYYIAREPSSRPSPSKNLKDGYCESRAASQTIHTQIPSSRVSADLP